jgi:hypothetical protein
VRWFKVAPYAVSNAAVGSGARHAVRPGQRRPDRPDRYIYFHAVPAICQCDAVHKRRRFARRASLVARPGNRCSARLSGQYWVGLEASVPNQKVRTLCANLANRWYRPRRSNKLRGAIPSRRDYWRWLPNLHVAQTFAPRQLRKLWERQLLLYSLFEAAYQRRLVAVTRPAFAGSSPKMNRENGDEVD